MTSKKISNFPLNTKTKQRLAKRNDRLEALRKKDTKELLENGGLMLLVDLNNESLENANEKLIALGFDPEEVKESITQMASFLKECGLDKINLDKISLDDLKKEAIEAGYDPDMYIANIPEDIKNKLIELIQSLKK